MSVESEDGREGLVDTPQFFAGQVSAEGTESGGVDGAELFDQHPSRVAIEVDMTTATKTADWSSHGFTIDLDPAWEVFPGDGTNGSIAQIRTGPDSEDLALTTSPADRRRL